MKIRAKNSMFSRKLSSNTKNKVDRPRMGNNAADKLYYQLNAEFKDLETISFHRTDTQAVNSYNPWNLVILYPKKYLNPKMNKHDYPHTWNFYDKNTYGATGIEETKYIIAFYAGSKPIRPIMYVGSLLKEGQGTATGLCPPLDDFEPPLPLGK